MHAFVSMPPKKKGHHDKLCRQYALDIVVMHVMKSERLFSGKKKRLPFLQTLFQRKIEQMQLQ